MIFDRSDYDERIVECDRRALCELFEEMTDRIRALVSAKDGPSEGHNDVLGYRIRLVDAFDGTIPKQEPVFLIRGQNEVGHLAVRSWAHHHRVNGGADPVYTRAMRHADKMEQWSKEHGKAATLPAEKQEGK